MSRRRRTKPVVIESVFNADYGTAKRTGTPSRRRMQPATHDLCTPGPCRYRRGTISACIVTTADGLRFLERTRVQRCSICGDRKTTLESRTPIA